MTTSHGLKTIPIFADLESSDLELLEAVAARRTLGRGEHLFFEDDPSVGFFALESGLIKIYKIAPDGREQVLYFIGPGQTFAIASLFGDGLYLANAEAVEPSKLWLIAKTPFLNLVRAEPELAVKLLAYLAQWMKRLLALVETLSLKNVEARLAEYILSRAHVDGRHTDDGDIILTLDVEKKMIAAHLGTISETFSRSLRKLKDRGLIREDGPLIIITDLEALRKIAAG
ncbi:MAG: Crp/Fnr family transcriptional regulator [Nitrospinae bacterium]|nr:Crp/Fnr family transcriptional regulator [Nitrospinota bacterium]